MIDIDIFTIRRAEIEAELAAALTELDPLRAAVKALIREDHAAGLRLYEIGTRASAAVRATDTGGSVVVGIVEEVRRERNIVAGRLNLARRLLANADWRVEVLRSDLAGCGKMPPASKNRHSGRSEAESRNP